MPTPTEIKLARTQAATKPKYAPAALISSAAITLLSRLQEMRRTTAKEYAAEIGKSIYNGPQAP